MQGRQPRSPDEEPAVTFEFEEAGQPERRSGLGALGTAAVGGAGLIASGAAPQLPDSLDVFDQRVEAGELNAPEAIPTTSFEELIDAAAEPAFPPLDFSVPAVASEASEALHGAVGAVGGGFRLDDPAGHEAFGASPEIEVVDVAPLDAPGEDADASDEDEDSDDVG